MLAYNPSLRRCPGRASEAAFAARFDAGVETDLDPGIFPAAPFTVEQALDPDFLPIHPPEDTP